MEQPPEYVAQGENVVCRLIKTIYGLKQSPRAQFEKFSLVIYGISFARCHSDHSAFVRHTKSDPVILTVYVDILLTGSDFVALAEEYLKHHFMTKDMRKPKKFLGIEVAYQKHRLLLSQRKYALDLLEGSGLLGCKHASTPMKANMDLWCDGNHPLEDPGQYRRLIKKLIYLTITRLDITFVVRVLSKFMQQLREVHWTTNLRIIIYVKSSPGKDFMYKKHEHVRIFGYSDSGYVGDKGDKQSNTRYCTIIGKNLVTWRRKKQDDVSRSSVEAEYRVMAYITCEMIWLKNLLLELGFKRPGYMLVFCDNQSAIYIAHNHVFHERTKHIEVNSHLIRDVLTKKVASLPFTPSSKQLADLLTEAASPKVFSNLCRSLGMIDIYSPEGVLDKLLGYWASTQ